MVLTNKKPSGNTQGADISRETAEADTGREDAAGLPADGTDPYISGSTLTSDDLDFWHMYDETESPEEEEEKEKKRRKKKRSRILPPTADIPRLVAEDGTEEWVSINPYLTKNTYDYSGSGLSVSDYEIL